jgi:4-coumarate--CoA ligase
VDELVHQFKITKATYVITVSSSLPVISQAVMEVGIPKEHIVLLDSAAGYLSIDDLIKEGLDSEPNFKERRLSPGEGKTKLAYLSLSSGTTGLPKVSSRACHYSLTITPHIFQVVAISHYAVICNVIQLSVSQNVNQNYAPWTQRRFRPGHVALASESKI